MTDIPQNWRNNDPPTSKDAGRANKESRAAQRHRLLKAAYYGDHLTGPDLGFNADEACRAAGYDPFGPTCYWHRCGDLRVIGAIAVVKDDDGNDVTRMGERGCKQMVCKITDLGIRAVFDPSIVRGDPYACRIRAVESLKELRELFRFYRDEGKLRPSKLADKLRRWMDKRAKELGA